MEESENGINLQELPNDDQDAGAKEQNDKELKEFEASLMKTIEIGDVEEITSKLNPRALTKCKTNTLYMSMKVSSVLRRRADKRGPDAEEFTKLANSVDEFTCSLLNPLKSNIESRHAFADSLDHVMDAAIGMEQKKILAHPVLYSLMNDKWFRELGQLRRSSWMSIEYWKWLFLNIWCLIDVVLFPVIFVVSYIIHICKDKARKRKEIAVVFLVNATSEVAEKTFVLMKDTMKYIIHKHGNDRAKYHVIIRDPEENSFQPHEVCFNSNYVNVAALQVAIEDIQRGNVDVPALHKDLKKANEAFESNTLRRDTEKVLIILTDHRICVWDENEQVMNEMTKVKKKQIKVITVAFGPHVNVRELRDIDDGPEVLHFRENENSQKVGRFLLQRVSGKGIYDSYLDYFTTPYFVFLRDALSFLVLLGLHFTICLETSRISLSGVEWAILVFFTGRVLFESEQFASNKVKKKTKNKRRNFQRTRCKGCKYLEEDGGKEQHEDKPTMFTMRFSKYISDRWNILDLITLIIYFTTFVLRMATLVLSESVTNNRSLVMAGYLYGLNTMFLTLRVFGHVMETTRQIGPIQIALFHILGDLVTIFWQFVATILAFSIAITKVYMAEKSFIIKHNGKELVCSGSGIACWWEMVRHLCWSLMGLGDLDILDSADGPSVLLVYFLYGAFLIIGVILLVNMMIALLSNTYQNVQDNSLMEWSFKKAITIQTYSSCHPIPVPLNLVSFLVKCCGWQKCFSRRCKHRQQPNEMASKNCFKAVVKDLESAYFAEYGYCFPLTDERKLDRVLVETERNRQMANQIAQRTFTASHTSEQSILPTGPQAWDSKGISVEECLLTCEGAKLCGVCKHNPFKYHGARYIIPFSPEFPHFEVLIQETGERRFLGVGVVWVGYGAGHAMPGWFDGTVGYHVDDGKIFDAKNPEQGREIEDVMAYRGDLIGCSIKFERMMSGKVPVVFTLNGRRITEDDIWIDYTPGGKLPYPYIGMGHEGMRVLAKMRPSGKTLDAQQIHHTITKDKGSRGRDLQLEQLLVAMVLNDIEEMKTIVDANFEVFEKEVQEVRGCVENAKSDSESMELGLSSSLTRVKNKFFYEDRERSPVFLPMEDDIREPYRFSLSTSTCEPPDRMAIEKMQERPFSRWDDDVGEPAMDTCEPLDRMAIEKMQERPLPRWDDNVRRPLMSTCEPLDRMAIEKMQERPSPVWEVDLSEPVILTSTSKPLDRMAIKKMQEEQQEKEEIPIIGDQSSFFKRLKNMFFYEDRETSPVLLPVKDDIPEPEMVCTSTCEPLDRMATEKMQEQPLPIWEDDVREPHIMSRMAEPLDRMAVEKMQERQPEKKEIPIIVELLRTIRRELEKIGKTTKEKTDDMLKELADIKNDAKIHQLSLQSKKAGLDKKFVELEELIQECCTAKRKHRF